MKRPTIKVWLCSIVLIVLVVAKLTGSAWAVESNANSILYFRAVGNDATGNSINLTSGGGDLIYRGKIVHFIPWYSCRWEGRPYWLFFLVNVSRTDFYIAYLYLDNVTSQSFGLYLFHYEDGAFGWLGGFTGEQFVGTITVFSPKVNIPPLSIQASAKFPNRLFALGASLEIVGNEGSFRNMRIYCLLNLYNVTESWNELWVLEIDGSNYYFGIFYMFNNDHSSVAYQYELRLNDLASRYTENRMNVLAIWYVGSAVRMPSSISCSVSPLTISLGDTVTVFGVISPEVSGVEVTLTYTRPDATSFSRKVLTLLHSSFVDIFVPDEAGSWKVVASWPGNDGYIGATSLPVSFTVEQHFKISVSPTFQEVKVGGTATFTIAITSIGGFNKPVYLSLSGHQTGVTYDFNPNPVTPSAGASASSTLTVYASSTASLETRTLTITASAPDPGITHTSTVSLTVAGKTDTTISCSLSVSTIRQGQNVTVSGSITPNLGANNDVILEYSSDGGSTWGTITTVKTDSGGSFSHVWSPSQGNYKVRLRWDGSATYKGATSSQQSLTVQPPGCIIATATYGSELSPEVQFLRGFRDGTVMSTFAGSQFMVAFNAWYYSFSPYVADFISKQPLLKEAMKILLYPLIGILQISASTYSALSFSPELAIVVTGLVASGLIGIIYLAPLSLIALLCMKRHRKFELSASHLKTVTAICIASIAMICLAEATTTQLVMMAATAILVLSTLALTALTTAQRIIQKLF